LYSGQQARLSSALEGNVFSFFQGSNEPSSGETVSLSSKAVYDANIFGKILECKAVDV
jgi:hypothetical protein